MQCPKASSLLLLGVSALAGIGCPAECEGVGCAELFTATLIGVMPGGIPSASKTGLDQASLLLEGEAERGPGFTALFTDNGLILGARNSGEVLHVDASALGTILPLEDRVFSRMTGEADNDAHGASVARVPDMDGDGRDELAVGAPQLRGGGTHIEAGAAYLHLGAGQGWQEESTAAEARVRILAESPGDHLGETIQGCPDLDGDGGGELLVGAPSNSDEAELGGAIYVLTSALLPTLESQVLSGVLTHSWRGESAGGQLGASMACLQGLKEPGDVALALSAPHAPGANSLAGAGVIYLVAAPLPATGSIEEAAFRVLRGTQAGSALGHDVATGDVDGDGLGDLLAGAPGTDDGAGAAFLWRGSDMESESASMTVLPLAGSDRLGRSVDVADFDGDGLDDLLVGAPRASLDVQGSFQGAIWIFLAASQDTWPTLHSVEEADVTIYSPQDFLRTGESFVTGDLDGDGALEVAMLLGRQP